MVRVIGKEDRYYKAQSQQDLMSNYLVAYYSMDGNANDSHIYGYNGTEVNPLYNSGIVGNGFNSGNDNSLRYINFPHNSDFSFTDGIQDVKGIISLWLYYQGIGITTGMLINKRDLSQNYEWQLQVVTGNTLRFIKFSNGTITSISYTTTNTLIVNNWHHILINIDIINNDIYINGLLQNVTINNSGYIKMVSNDANMRIAMATWTASSNLKIKGIIDETAIYKGINATPTQVAQLYNYGNGLNYNQTLLI